MNLRDLSVRDVHLAGITPKRRYAKRKPSEFASYTEYHKAYRTEHADRLKKLQRKHYIVRTLAKPVFVSKKSREELLAELAALKAELGE